MDFGWLLAPDPETARHRNPPLVRYAFAIAVSAVAGLLAMWSEKLTPGLIPTVLPAFAAIIVSAAWAGFGPGLVCTSILTVWVSQMPVPGYAATLNAIILRSSLFFLEGLTISACCGRLLRTMTDASRSEEWHRSLVETSSEGI